MKKVNGMKRKINQHTVPRCESEDKNRDRFSSSFFLPATRERHTKLKKREYKKLHSPCAFIFLVYRSRGALDNVHTNGNDFNTADIR